MFAWRLRWSGSPESSRKQEWATRSINSGVPLRHTGFHDVPDSLCRMRCPGCCGVHHLPIRSPRAPSAAGFPRRAGGPALHWAGAQGGPRAQVPQPSAGGSAPRWPGGERHRGGRRSARPRHGHLGAHQRCSAPITRFRPRRTGCSPCGPPTRRAMPSAARAVGYVGHADGAVANRASPRARVHGPPRPRRTSGHRGRRRRHHRGHVASSSGCTAPCRRRRTAPVRRCLHARRICRLCSPPAGARSSESDPRGVTHPIASHR